jgi:hypothetical protein
MTKQTLSAEQVRTLIEKAGVGDSFHQKTLNVAARTHCGESTLWLYLKRGTTSRQSPTFLIHLAIAYQIIERPADLGTPFIV